MGKSKKAHKAEEASTQPHTVAQDDSFDPALASLFASSSGPVKVPVKTPRTAPLPVTEAPSNPHGDVPDPPSSPEASSPEDDASDDSEGSSKERTVTTHLAAGSSVERPRKRRRIAAGDNLEEAYFARLEREEEKENRLHGPENVDADIGEDEGSSEDLNNNGVDVDEVDVVPSHEIFDKKMNDRATFSRTVFLGNISTDVIKAKAYKRELVRHLRSVLKPTLDAKRVGKLETIRFRSTAYATGSGPKRATFAKKELMDKTTTSTNAYAVFTTESAAERVAEKLNGTVVLGRHLRADWLAKPMGIDHKRCVFIGNLSFVNEETPAENGSDNEGSKRRPTAKEPADAEEGLWRIFSKVGQVESVRVVRDQETRVGKGIAYVQFNEENSVEAALLMNDKKFPPMLPRKLRVMRAKKTKTRPMGTGAGSKQGERPVPGRGRAQMTDGRSSRAKGGSMRGVIFEGHRATGTANKTASPKKKHKKRPDTRSSRRGAAYKAAKAKKRKQGA